MARDDVGRTDSSRATSRSINTHFVIAGIISIVALGGFIAWSTATELAGAVVAPGTFIVSSRTKNVQHVSGGIIAKIFVGEDTTVRVGDPLVALDDTQSRANLMIVTKRLDELTARLARLEAERDGLLKIEFPDILLSRINIADVRAAITSENRLFSDRSEVRSGQKSQLAQKVFQFEREIEGLKAQEDAFSAGIEVLSSEISSLSRLREKGAIADQRLNVLKTQAATFGGERGEKIAYQAQVGGRIVEANLQLLQIDQELKAEVSREIAEVLAQIGEVVERKVAAQDELDRIVIRSPTNGIVHDLAVHTTGGVIKAGETISKIVPVGDSLLLETKVNVEDIERIEHGQNARIRLIALNRRTTPELHATVKLVAADSSVDERTGSHYFSVQLQVQDAGLLKRIGARVVPGMPGEALIETGTRTPLSYLTKPLSDQLNRAFREE